MDLNAEFSYHMGGALYIPQRRAPSPEPVTSSAVALPESVPSSSATTDMSPANTHNPITSVTVKDGGIVENSYQSSLDEDEYDGRTGSAEYSSDDSEPPLSESSRPLKRSHQEDQSRPLKRGYQEDQSSKQEASNTPPRPSKRSRKTDSIEKWDERLEELKRFKAEHGHCRVPTSCGSLNTWLSHQRNASLNPNSPNCLKDALERERRTKEIESVLGASLCDASRILTGTSADAIHHWDARLEELKKFKAKHGHCRLPITSGSLYGWLNHQRNRPLNPNSPRYLKDALERKRRTKELETVLGESLCDRRIPQRTIPTEASNWANARLEELKKSEAQHGLCRVPTPSDSLCGWLTNQRSTSFNPNSPQYLKNASERELRTKELESVSGTGLWDGRIPKHTTEVQTWNARLEELKKFKAEHGHCLLSLTSSQALYHWVRHQQKYLLNPNSSKCLKDTLERERRTKELESVLGASLCDGARILTGTSGEASNWDANLEELKRFKAKHGHCLLPPSSGSLYGWLRNQLNGPLNPNSPRYLKDALERERRTIELETVLGENLCDGQIATRTKGLKTWNARLEELKKFKAEHGHCLLSVSSSQALYHWVRHQQKFLLNPNSSKCLKDTLERERRTKELESVLGASLCDGRIPQRSPKEAIA